MNTCSCLNLILACIVYWQACEISRVLRECDPLASGIALSLLEHVSPIEWDNVVLYGQYILNRKLVRQRRRAKRVVLSRCRAGLLHFTAYSRPGGPLNAILWLLRRDSSPFSV